MVKYNRKSILIALAVGVCVLCSVSFSFGADIKVIEPEQVVAPSNSLITNPTPRFKIEVNKFVTGSKARMRTAYPEKYDLRKLGLVTSVKNQGSYGTCWAFAACSSAESSMIKQGYVGSNVDYSEAHLVNFYYNRPNDPLGNTNGDKQGLLSGKYPYNSGGNDTQTLIALSGWTGIADETTVPYSEVASNNIATNLAYKDAAIIKNGFIIPNDIETVKQALMDYGALNIAYYANNTYFGDDNISYYCNQTQDANHEVSIVGWDDNYSRDKFSSSEKPSSDGAWIVKNSWGSSSLKGEEGYIYISYEDKSLTDIIAYQFQPVNAYDHNYYYDGNSNPSKLAENTSETKAGNVYTVKGNSDSGTELIKAVGMVSYAPGANYSVQIYSNLVNSANPESGTPMLSTATTGIVKGAGFTTIELNKAVAVKQGDKFSVVIKLSNLPKNSSGTYDGFGVETALSNEEFVFKASSDSNQSFWYTGASWKDLKDYEACARIKAFTVDCHHQWGAWRVTKAATSTAGGVETRTCAVCGEEETRNTAPLIQISKIEVHPMSAIYTGEVKKPTSFVVTAGGKNIDSSNYTVQYEGSFVNAGSYKIKVKGIGKYTGTIEKAFTISKANATLSYSNTSISKSLNSGTFTNPIKKVTDGTISYSSSNTSVAMVSSTGQVTMKKPGKTVITATSKEGANYKGTSVSYTLNISRPILGTISSVKTKLYGYDDIMTSWNKVNGASGYKVYYKKSINGKFYYKGTTTATSMKLANLKDGERYYVKVVPYKTVNGVGYNGDEKVSYAIYTLKKIGTPKVVKKTSKKVTVKWANILGESGYQISKSTSKKKLGTIYTIKTTYGSSKVLSAQKGKTYYYKVRGYKMVGSKRIVGPWSKVRAYKLK